MQPILRNCPFIFPGTVVNFPGKELIPLPIVTSAEMFRKAYEGGYAIGAFNVNNMEIVQGELA